MKKTKLYSLDLHLLRQDEVAAFIERFVTDYAALDLNDTLEIDFVTLFQNMSSKLPEYKEAVNQIKAQAESAHIFELDIIRDKKLITLGFALQVFTHTDDEAEKAAFDLLKTLFKTYKNLGRENFETESLLMTKLIAELNSTKYATAVEVLALQNHINKMEMANENFKTLFSARSTSINTTQVYDAKKLNIEILNSYKKLATYILTMTSIKDVPFYNSVFKMTNNVREYYATIIARRGGKDSEKKEE